MARAIATVGGIALVPGVSRNGRLYTRDAIAKMVTRAQARLGTDGIAITRDPEEAGDPLTQLTHHGAEDDSTRIVGRITSIGLDENGAARYAGEIADTPHGHAIASLLDTSDGQPPYLKGVSIRGAWVGTVRKVRGPDGSHVETADDLELDGLDYTRKPGVPGAQVDTFAWSARSGRTETTERVLITESAPEALVTVITEETGQAVPQATALREALRSVLPEIPHVLDNGDCLTCAEVGEASVPLPKRGSGLKGDGGKVYADPGFQPDKKQRYDLTTKADAKAAWTYISQKDNAAKYSGAQLKRVKSRIVRALKSFGVTVTAESAGLMFDAPFQVSEAVAEFYGDPSCAGSWCVRATNGPVTIDLSSYSMDPGDLDKIIPAAADAVCKALASLDPDMDGDVDVPGVGDGSDTDGDAPGESAPDGTVTETVPVPDPASEAGQQEGEEPAMADTTTATPAAETAPPALDAAAIAEAAVAKYEADRKARKAAKRAARPAAEAAPAAPAVTETADERVARLVEQRAAARIAAEVAPAVTETEEQRIDRLVEARVTAEKQRLVASGVMPAGRKGLTDPVNEHSAPVPGGATGEMNSHGMPADWPDKPLHQFTTEEMDRYCGPVTTRHVLGPRADLLG